MPENQTDIMTTSVISYAEQCNAAAIIVISDKIVMAREIAKSKPKTIILAVTSNESMAQQCLLYKGIVPVYFSSGMIFSITIDLYVVMYIIITRNYKI